jgi:hypothetical protein
MNRRTSSRQVAYDQAVQELWDRNKYNPSKMTKKDAEGFVEQIKRSKDPRIAPFRDTILQKGAKYELLHRGDGMKETQSPPLDELLSALRAMFFELMWPGFRWIESLWIRKNNDQYQLFVQTAGTKDKESLDGFNYLVGEVFKNMERALDELAPGAKHKIEHTIQYGPSAPRDGEYQELMSDRVFKMIAKRHTPWRLDDGETE